MTDTPDDLRNKAMPTYRKVLGGVALVAVLVGLAISVKYSHRRIEEHRPPAARSPSERRAKSVKPKRKLPVQEKDFVGGRLAGHHDRPEPPALLIGLEITYDWITKPYQLYSIQPIYLGPDGKMESERYGQVMIEKIRVEAKEGYAVGGLVAQVDRQLQGFRLVFMRIKEDALDPNDRHESRWLGMRGEGEEIEIGCDGRKVVGLKMPRSNRLSSIGLIFDDEPLPLAVEGSAKRQ